MTDNSTALVPASLTTLDQLNKYIAVAGDFGVRNMATAKMPFGSSTEWVITSADGTENAEKITGVILHTHAWRKYYVKGYGEGEDGPPDCASADGIEGIGNNGTLGHHICDECPLGNFQGDDKPVCEQRRMFYVLTDKRTLPIEIDFPPGGLGVASAYMGALLDRQPQRAPEEIITEFSIVRSGKDSRPRMVNKGQLDASVIADVRAYKERLMPIFKRSHDAQVAYRERLLMASEGAIEGKATHAAGFRSAGLTDPGAFGRGR